MAALNPESKHRSEYTHETDERDTIALEDEMFVHSSYGEKVVRAEYENPEFCTMIADWCNGGSQGRKMKVTTDDVEILESNGQRPLSTHQRIGEKTGRNDPCPCGSNKKFKKCCGI